MPHKIEKFGSYILLEKIASGGMAEIYLARSAVANGLNKFVAVKRILPHLNTDEEFVTMFKHEAKIAINLNHNNVVSLFYFGCEDNQYYLVMDYIEGKTLYQINSELKKIGQRLSTEQILYLAKEAAAGLDHAHRCLDPSTNKPLGIIHRDISPQNIMLSFEGAVKVIDFGIAKTGGRNNTTEVGTYKGKFSYMSPEQAEGIPVDTRSDIFSLGVVIWELLANDRMFAGNTNLEILRNVKRCNFKKLRDINPTIPVELENILNRALKKDRNERYQTAAEFSKDINRFLNVHYPNFSHLEFSKQMKTVFQQEYEKRRASLVEYSNLNLNEINDVVALNKPHKKNTLSDHFEPVDSYEKTTPQIYQDPVLSIVTSVGDLPDGLAENIDSSKNIQNTAKHEFDKLAQNTPAQPHEDISDLNKYLAPISVLIQNNKPGAEKKIVFTEEESLGDRYLRYSIIFILLIFGFTGFNEFIVPKIKKSMKPRDIATVSTPSKNKQPTSNQNIELHAANASTSEQNVSLNEEKSPVQKAFEAKKGFANINLSEENADIRIMINGIQLLDKPPLFMYPILADREVVIAALNLKTNKMVQKKVQVKPGESVDLTLDLNSEADSTK